MALLTVRDLKLGYDARVIAEGIGFTVNAGDYLCIVGENGSGKTTLMKTLLRLKEPLGGEILFGDGVFQNEIGYLPQQTVVQKDFPASVREIVLWPDAVTGSSPGDSSSVCFSQGPCARRGRSCFWTNRCPASIPGVRRRCTI